MARLDWIPKYIKQVIKNLPRDRVDANYWNSLWNLVISQGDNNSEGVVKILDKLEELDDEIEAMVGRETYVHNQLSVSDSWVVYHNLEKYPAVTVVDSAGTEVEGDVIYLDLNRVLIRFSVAFSGKAYCN